MASHSDAYQSTSFFPGQSSHLEPLRGSGPAARVHDPQPYDACLPPPYGSSQPSRPLQRVNTSLPSPLSASSRHWASSVLLRAVSSLLSFALVGVLARALALYDDSKHEHVFVGSGLIMPAWPREVSLTPTWLMLAAGITVGLLGMVAIGIMACTESRSRRTRRPCLSPFLSAVMLSAGIALWISALALFRLMDGEKSLYGWSCEHRQYEVIEDDNVVGLGMVCTSLNAAWGLGVAVAVFEVLSLSLLVVTTVMDMRDRKIGAGPGFGMTAGQKGYHNLEFAGTGQEIPMVGGGRFSH